MRKYIIKITAVVLTAASIILYSCSLDKSSIYDNKVYNDFGEVSYLGDDGYFEIIRDDGALLRVMDYVGSNTVEEGQRVYFKYTIMPYGESNNYNYQQKAYDIKLIIFNNINCPHIVRESFLAKDAPHRSDSLGNDLIRIYTAAFSGDYVNIEFEYFRFANSTEPHMINLVWDDTRNPKDSVFLQLRHNALGEVDGAGEEIVSDTGLASFKLSDLIPEDQNSIDIKIRFNMDRKDGVGEYIKTEKCITGTFPPPVGKKTYILGNELSPPANTTAFIKHY